MSIDTKEVDQQNVPLSKDAIFDILINDILSGRLPPGTPLVERALSNRFGLSRTPIRQVLWRLEQDGLVDSYPNQGSYVRHLTVTDIRDLFQVREALEPLAAALAAEERPDNEVHALREEFERHDPDNADPGDLGRLGEHLHQSIVNWSQNLLLQNLYELIRKKSALMRSMSRRRVDIEVNSYRDHLAILGAIEKQCAEGARDAMLAHLRHSSESVIQLLRP